MKMKARLFCIVSVFLNIFPLFSVAPDKIVHLPSQKPSWQSVLGGEAVAPIAETSYGFAVVSDGRMISGCTSKGTVLWQKSVRGIPSNHFSAWGDFLYLVTDKTVLNLINPSGVTVWSSDCGFKIAQPPLSGRDSRVFVHGKEFVACYGILGGLKWSVKIPQIRDDGLKELNDGSLLLIKDPLTDGKSTGTRISPFGEILEEITFAGEILSADSCDDGLLMTFSDGSCGLCSVQNDSLSSVWVKKNPGFSGEKFEVIGAKNSSCFLSGGKNGMLIQIIDNKSGGLKNQFSADDFDLASVLSSKKTDAGFFAANKNKAVEFTEDGEILWEAHLPPRSKWNYAAYTDKNQLVLCMKNWVLNSYTMSQSVSANKIQYKQKKKPYVTSSAQNQKIDGVSYVSMPLSKIEEIKLAFESGNYGAREKLMLSQLKEQTENFIGELRAGSNPATRSAASFFKDNPIFTQNMIEAAAVSQTDMFTGDLARMIELEKDLPVLNSLVRAAGKIRYDGEGELLKALGKISESQTARSDGTLCRAICDSTYEIVNFMGRPALNSQGKNILTNFLYPKYRSEIREYARETLSKIALSQM